MKKILLFIVAMVAYVGAYAQVAAGDYYIQNVETGLYLNGAHDWGTRASVTAHGQLMTVGQLEDGKYTIDTHISNGGEKHYLGSNNYVDADAVSLDMEAVEGGYTIACDGNLLVVDNGYATFTEGAEVTNAAKWVFVTKEEVVASLAAASAANPVDATLLIYDSSFGRNNQYFENWQGSPAKGGANDNMCAEKWNCTFDVFQVLENMPAGNYILKVQGFYRAGNGGCTDDVRNAILYANGTEMGLRTLGSEEECADGADYEGVKLPNSMGQASNCFSAGQYENTLEFTLEEAGTLTIGVKKSEEVANDWTIFDNFRLIYCGPAAPKALEAGDYYIQNVETGLFLNGAHDWGTRASVTAHGQLMTVGQLEDGKYTIDTHISNGGEKHYLGSNNYVDADAVSLDMEAVEGGYTIACDGNLLVVDNGYATFTEGAEATNAAKWVFVTKEEVLAALETASAENPVDATLLIYDSNFGRNNQYFENWQGSPAKGGANENMCAEKFSCTFDVFQVLENMPAGNYILKAQGFYRAGNGGCTDDVRNAILYANGTEMGLRTLGSEEECADGADYEGVKLPNSMGQASNCFSAGQYENTLEFTLEEAGTLTIGVKKSEEVANDWTIFDNFRLIYCGPAPEVVDNSVKAITCALWDEEGEDGLPAPLAGIETKVEPYDGYVIIRGVAGVAGYDLKVAYDENQNVTCLTPIEFGEEIEDVTEGDALVWANGKNCSFFWAHVGKGYAYASADEEGGYVVLCAWFYTDEDDEDPVWGQYCVSWPFVELEPKVVYNEECTMATITVEPTQEGTELYYAIDGEIMGLVEGELLIAPAPGQYNETGAAHLVVTIYEVPEGAESLEEAVAETSIELDFAKPIEVNENDGYCAEHPIVLTNGQVLTAADEIGMDEANYTYFQYTAEKAGMFAFASKPGKITLAEESGLEELDLNVYVNLTSANGVYYGKPVEAGEVVSFAAILPAVYIEKNDENTPLITNVAQLSSPYTEPSEGSLAGLIDGNASTFWHSAWSTGSVAAGVHYLQVEMPDTDVPGVTFTYTRRNINSDQTTVWGIYGTDVADAAKEDCEELAVVEMPLGSQSETLTSEPFATKGYKYVRFYAEETNSNRGYFHIAEFQMYPTEAYSVIKDVTEYEFHASVENEYASFEAPVALEVGGEYATVARASAGGWPAPFYFTFESDKSGAVTLNHTSSLETVLVTEGNFMFDPNFESCDYTVEVPVIIESVAMEDDSDDWAWAPRKSSYTWNVEAGVKYYLLTMGSRDGGFTVAWSDEQIEDPLGTKNNPINLNEAGNTWTWVASGEEGYCTPSWSYGFYQYYVWTAPASGTLVLSNNDCKSFSVGEGGWYEKDEYPDGPNAAFEYSDINYSTGLSTATGQVEEGVTYYIMTDYGTNGDSWSGVGTITMTLNGAPVGINGIAADSNNKVIFNLAGARQMKAQKGVNIINGQKLLVK